MPDFASCDVWEPIRPVGTDKKLMADDTNVRATVAGDEPDLEALYKAALPEEDLLPLVRRLLREEPDILSLTATVGPQLVGHVIFTPCGVGDRDGGVALLGPLAVAPSRQRRGVGGALVREGVSLLARREFTRVLVLGDPNYYGRLGFRPENSILPPYDLPAEWSGAWQSMTLRSPTETPIETIRGVLRCPSAWLSPALWSS